MAAPLAPAAERGRARPSPQTVARVLTRDETCVFPGCRVPAFRCDLDHVVAPRPGADDPVVPAERDEVVGLLRGGRVVVVRARDGWRPALLADGSVRWTAPSGHTYVRPVAARTA